MPRISLEAQTLIQMYGIYFIQFPKFTYLGIGGFKEEPVRLSRYALECFIIAKICRQLFLMIKDNLPQEKWESVFPIKLGYSTYSNMINASVVGSNLLSFNFGSYRGRRNFDSKGFAAKILSLKGQSPTVPHLEDLW